MISSSRARLPKAVVPREINNKGPWKVPLIWMGRVEGGWKREKVQGLGNKLCRASDLLTGR